jgi:hypothetical protein
MSRSLGNLASHTGDSELNPFFAVELMFDTEQITYKGQTIQSEPLYLWTGYGDLVADSKTYVGAGNFLHISDVTETADVRAAGASLTLAGLDNSILALAISQPYQGRVCNIKFGLLDEAGALIDISTLFTGYMDQMNIEEGADTSTIQVTVESKLIDLERPRIFRYTAENQKAKFENDQAFDFIPDLQDQPLIWGRKS